VSGASHGSMCPMPSMAWNAHSGCNDTSSSISARGMTRSPVPHSSSVGAVIRSIDRRTESWSSVRAESAEIAALMAPSIRHGSR
jgi:hypothetical protein